MDHAKIVKAKPKYYVFPGVKSDRDVVEKIITLTPQQIIETIANYFEVSEVDVRGKKSYRKYAYPRHVCVYFMKNYAFIPYAQIGRIFGRDHTTAIHSMETVNSWIATNDEMVDKIADIKNIFCG